MRRLIIPVPVFVMVLVGLALTACKHEAASSAGTQATPAADLVSVLNMSDPQAATQLTRGFWSLESGSWRWTASKFAVTLRVPAGSAQTGARLDLKVNLPEAVMKDLAPLTLSATAGGATLAPETYTAAGSYTFTRDVPAAVFSGDKISIEFATDKSVPPGVDKRELALIVTKVGLTAK
jgi:hypothetical protein